MRSEKPYTKSENVVLKKTRSQEIWSKNINFRFSMEKTWRSLLATFWCQFGSHPMILVSVIVNYIRGIPQTQTIHKVAIVVTKTLFPPFLYDHLSHIVLSTLVTDSYTMIIMLSSISVSCLDIFYHLPHIVLSALVAGSYTMICYQAFVWVVWTFSRSILEYFKKYFLKKFHVKFLQILRIFSENFGKYFEKS